MDFGFEEWPKDELVNYLNFLMYHYRVVDAFWYLNVEETHGPDEADRINEAVWAKGAQLAARKLKKIYKFPEGGLQAFLKAQKLFPWAMLMEYDFEVGEDEIIIHNRSCPVQEARVGKGLPEYACKPMHQAEFDNFAHEIDPRIKVECLFAPPDDHPADHHCSWRFTLEE